MNLKVYYQKIRDVAASIPEPEAVVASLETPDGGRAGVLTEVPRQIAARLVVEGKARLALSEEVVQFRAELERAKQAHEERMSAAQMRITVVSESDLQALRNSSKGQKQSTSETPSRKA